MSTVTLTLPNTNPNVTWSGLPPKSNGFFRGRVPPFRQLVGFYVILLTNKQINKVKHNLLGGGNCMIRKTTVLMILKSEWYENQKNQFKWESNESNRERSRYWKWAHCDQIYVICVRRKPAVLSLPFTEIDWMMNCICYLFCVGVKI